MRLYIIANMVNIIEHKGDIEVICQAERFCPKMNQALAPGENLDGMLQQEKRPE
jgi:hypothetical protein